MIALLDSPWALESVWMTWWPSVTSTVITVTTTAPVLQLHTIDVTNRAHRNRSSQDRSCCPDVRRLPRTCPNIAAVPHPMNLGSEDFSSHKIAVHFPRLICQVLGFFSLQTQPVECLCSSQHFKCSCSRSIHLLLALAGNVVALCMRVQGKRWHKFRTSSETGSPLPPSVN